MGEMKMLLYDRKRCFAWKWMMLGIGVLTVLTIVIRMDEIAEIIRSNVYLPEGWCAEFLVNAWSGQAFMFCVPILCSLPAASAFVDEYQTGMSRLALGRIERKRYLVSKAGSAAVSGGVIVLVGLLASAVVVFALFRPLVSAEATIKTEEQISMMQMFLPVLSLVLRFFCLGALGAVTGLTISTAVGSRYMAWLSPFMAEYLLIILYERYLDGIPIISPKEWILPSEGWPLQGWSTVFWMLGICFLMMAAFIQIGGKRLEVL